MKCGWLFNRHDWFYAHRTHKICFKCGETQESIDSSQGSFWSRQPFDAWLKSLESMIKWDKRYDDSSKKALEWVKNKPGYVWTPPHHTPFGKRGREK